MINKALQKTLGFGFKEAAVKADKGGYVDTFLDEDIKFATEEDTARANKVFMEYITLKLVLDPLWWRAIGVTEGWGEWTIPYTEFKHKWELSHYEPDTGKTPVYCCSCGARKIHNVICWDNSCEWPEEWEEKPNKGHHMSAHGSHKRPTAREKYLLFFQTLYELITQNYE